MSLLLSLLAASSGASGAVSPAPVPPQSKPAFPLGVESQIIIDGNSISANHGSIPTLAQLMIERLGSSLNGASIVNAATNGETWADMLKSGGPYSISIESVRDKNRPFCAVIIGETTNSIRGGRSVEDTKADVIAYVKHVRELIPQAVIIAWPALPTGHADEATYPGDAAENAAIVEVNEWMRGNAKSIGIDLYLDVRAAVPMFNHDGNSAGNFTKYQQWWQEAPPSTNNWAGSFGWLHPAVGEYPSSEHPMGVGKRAIADYFAQAFLTGKIPATA